MKGFADEDWNHIDAIAAALSSIATNGQDKTPEAACHYYVVFFLHEQTRKGRTWRQWHPLVYMGLSLQPSQEMEQLRIGVMSATVAHLIDSYAEECG
eukprot:8149460-Ditylum_brightwellii.AAC.1